jgi:hypothetical protein
MAFNREAALAEGYTEDEINAYLQAEAEKQKQPAPPVVDVGDPPAPSTKINTVGTSAEAVGTTAGLGLAPYALPAAAAGAAALGGSKLYSGWKSGVDAANEYNRVTAANAQTHAATQELKTLRQIAQGTGPEADAAKQRIQQIIQNRPGPVAPTAMPGNAPVAGPVAPQAQPASMASRVQAAAANKIQNLPGASMMGQAGKFAGKLLPGVGTALNAADAYNRAQEGDYLGAGIAGVGAAASPFPVVGTAVGMGTGAINAYRDYLKRQEEEKKRMGR